MKERKDILMFETLPNTLPNKQQCYQTKGYTLPLITIVELVSTSYLPAFLLNTLFVRLLPITDGAAHQGWPVIPLQYGCFLGFP